MTTQNNPDNRPLTRYETKHRRLWGLLNNTEGGSGSVISYWCHELPVEPKRVL